MYFLQRLHIFCSRKCLGITEEERKKNACFGPAAPYAIVKLPTYFAEHILWQVKIASVFIHIPFYHLTDTEHMEHQYLLKMTKFLIWLKSSC